LNTAAAGRKNGFTDADYADDADCRRFFIAVLGFRTWDLGFLIPVSPKAEGLKSRRRSARPKALRYRKSGRRATKRVIVEKFWWAG